MIGLWLMILGCVIGIIVFGTNLVFKINKTL